MQTRSKQYQRMQPYCIFLHPFYSCSNKLSFTHLHSTFCCNNSNVQHINTHILICTVAPFFIITLNCLQEIVVHGSTVSNTLSFLAVHNKEIQKMTEEFKPKRWLCCVVEDYQSYCCKDFFGTIISCVSSVVTLLSGNIMLQLHVYTEISYTQSNLY